MHMKLHQRSITIMGCLDELNLTQRHQRKLKNIYNHASPSQQKSQSYQKHKNSTLDPKKDYELNFTHKCIQSDGHRAEKNKKLSDLHKNSHLAETNRKHKEILSKNKKLVTKLLNVHSNLESLNQPKSQEKQKYSMKKLLQNGIIGDVEALNMLSGFNQTSNTKFKSSSAINRHKQSIRIMTENRNIKQRLFTAMSSSQYSQQRLNKFNKTYNSIKKLKFGYSRPLSQYFSQQNKGKVWKYNQISKGQNSQIDVQEKNDEFTKTKQFKMKTQGNLATYKKEKKNQSRNQIAKLLQKSVDYVQNNQYRTTIINRETTKKMVNPLNDKESESIKMMRKAAMLHFRKVQKLKTTQSKVWQICELKNKIKAQQSINEKQIFQSQLDKNKNDSILLTELG